MIRLATLAALLSATLAPGAVAQSALPALKADVTVTSEAVRIGDLFDNAGAIADIAIFRAPDLGGTGHVPVQAVLDAVRTHGLTKIATGGVTEVSVTRASRRLAIADIKAEITRAIGARHPAIDLTQLAVALDGDARALHLDPDATGSLAARRLDYDTRSGRFQVVFAVPGAARVTQIRFTGSAVETVEIPVLTRPLARGDVVTAADLTMARRPKAEAGQDVILDQVAAIGKSTRRAMRAGQALPQTELTRPELVERNAAVTIFYELPGLTLTVRGKALQGGAEGDIIDVTNTQSKRNFQAVVMGQGRVSVTPAAPHRTPDMHLAAAATTRTE